MRPTKEPHSLETAVPLDLDSSAYLATLESIHAAAVSGSRLPAHPRAVVHSSWQRMQRRHLSAHIAVPDVDAHALENSLATFNSYSSVDLAYISDFLKIQLAPILEGTQLVGIFTTADSRLIDRFGPAQSLRRADHLGFVRGARWSEPVVGTNAIGTAAVTGRPLQIHGPEHWCVSQHEWSCSAAPILDPRNGSVLGILDISGPLDQAHPALLGMVTALARQVELQLRSSHLMQLERVRSSGWAAVASLSGPWVLVDRWGWVAASSGLDVGTRLAHFTPLTDSAGEGVLAVSGGETGIGPEPGPSAREVSPGIWMLEGLGTVEVTRAGSGLVVQPISQAERASYRLDTEHSRLLVRVAGAENVFKLSPRHCEILRFLADSSQPQPLDAVMAGVWGSGVSKVTARAEMSRLRKRFPELVSAAPYRLMQELTS